MIKNMGSVDRVLRIIAAVIFTVLFFMGTITGTTAQVMIVLAGVFLITSLIGFCPLYTPFGLSTCPEEDS
jgi:hypothetical protein